LTCRIIRGLEPVRYSHEDKKGGRAPKVVYYFLMEAEGGSLAVNYHEIDRAEWFEPEEARRALSYEHDRNLFDSVIASGLE
jgi:diadenosine hexaphosphate hydrolase (ATP-forming)